VRKNDIILQLEKKLTELHKLRHKEPDLWHPLDFEIDALKKRLKSASLAQFESRVKKELANESFYYLPDDEMDVGLSSTIETLKETSTENSDDPR
jgi:hypothetical protein